MSILFQATLEVVERVLNNAIKKLREREEAIGEKDGGVNSPSYYEGFNDAIGELEEIRDKVLKKGKAGA